MDKLFKEMRELCKNHDIVIVTAKQAPRRGPVRVFPPLNGVLIIDYISVLK